MANDARMTVRLDPATRRRVERLAAREGISLNEALNQRLQRAPDRDLFVELLDVSRRSLRNAIDDAYLAALAI